MAKNNVMWATLAALATQIIFGFSFMFTKIALQFATPMTVIANRYMIAFLGLTLAAIFTHKKPKLGKNIWRVVLMAIFQPVLYFVCETYGVQFTTSAFSSVIIALTPVVCILPAFLVLREKPSSMQYVFTAISVMGVVMLSLAGESDGVVTFAGVLFLFGAVLSSSAYIIMSRKLSDTYSAFERTYIMTVTGLVFFVVLACIEQWREPTALLSSFQNLQYTFSLLYLGIVSSVLAFLFLNYANTYLPVAKTTVFLSVNMVVSVSAGIVFLDEPFSFVTISASVLVLIGVCGVQVLDGKNAKKAQKRVKNTDKMK